MRELQDVILPLFCIITRTQYTRASPEMGYLGLADDLLSDVVAVTISYRLMDGIMLPSIVPFRPSHAHDAKYVVTCDSSN
jgi:hypothetical protein